MADVADTVAGVVTEFLNEREGYITAINKCSNDADYWRWQGHAEARRQLAERLTKVMPPSAAAEPDGDGMGVVEP